MNARERMRAACLAAALLIVTGACGSESKPRDRDTDHDEVNGAEESGEDTAPSEDDDDQGDVDDVDDDEDKPKKPDSGAANSRDAGPSRSSERSVASNDAGKGAAATASDAAGRTEAAPPASPPASVSGPADGEAGAPVVAIPDAKCGGAGGLDGLVGANFGGFPVPGTPNVKIGGRDVVLTYPCNKREGAHVTFILNLHGTMPDEGLKLYQHSYFAAHKLVASHNLIVASPKSVVSQWGNGDGGKDLPHLYEVINWVYEKFSKFQITGLWVAGHSWGSMYAKNFVCDAMLKDRARGIIGMSGGATGVGGIGGAFGGGGNAGCADRLSQIHTVGDAEGGEAGVPDQSAVAMKHGCAARLAPMDIGSGQMLYNWPNCDPGWVHFNFVMGAHDHITPLNDNVVKYIVDQIKSTEMR